MYREYGPETPVDPETLAEKRFLAEMRKRGLTAADMLFLVEEIPNAINSPVQMMRNSVMRGQTEGSKRKREGKERMNAVTPEMVRDAVHAVARTGKEPSKLTVCEYIDAQRKAEGRLKNGLYQRLMFSTRDPIIQAQKQAYETAVAEVELERKKRMESDKTAGQSARAPDTEPPVPTDPDSGSGSDRADPALEVIRIDDLGPKGFVAHVEPESAQAPKRGAEWKPEKTPETLLKDLADDVEDMLKRVGKMKQQDWVKQFAQRSVQDLEDRIIQWDNALVTLEESLAGSTWNEEKETEYRRIRAHLREIEKELDGINSSLST